MARQSTPALRAKRVLVSTDEDGELNQLVTRLAAQMNTTVTLSNLQRACLRLLLHAAPNIYEIARAAGEKVIFKGGTSLSNGWNLIERFSEDIDIFLDSQAFTPTLGKRGIDRELKRLRDAVGEQRRTGEKDCLASGGACLSKRTEAITLALGRSRLKCHWIRHRDCCRCG